MDKVLIVEDSRMVLKVLNHLASHELDCEADIASSLAEANKLLETGKYSCAIVDLCLPDAPEGEVVDLVLSHKIPTIVLTSNFNQKTRNQMLEKGVVDYVLKESRDCFRYAIGLVNQLLKNRNYKVLIADDSKVSLRHISGLLKQLLFQVHVARNGQEAWEMISSQQDFKLVITDFNMPIMDGVQLVQQIRSHYGRDELPVIGLSSVDNSQLSARFIKHGANDYLSKPFIHEEFHCRILHTIEQLSLIEQIRDAGNRDYLTGLYNRRYFFEKGKQQVTVAIEQDKPLSVAMIDLDHFKQINDTYGHEAGDDVLKQFSVLLDEVFGRFLPARFGGEEFVVALAGISLERAETLFDSFRFKVMEYNFMSGDQPISVTISTGLSALVAGAQSNDDLDGIIRRADMALYNAKSEGRNRVEVES